MPRHREHHGIFDPPAPANPTAAAARRSQRDIMFVVLLLCSHWLLTKQLQRSNTVEQLTELNQNQNCSRQYDQIYCDLVQDLF